MKWVIIPFYRVFLAILPLLHANFWNNGVVFYEKFGEDDRKNIFGVGCMLEQRFVNKQTIEGI